PIAENLFRRERNVLALNELDRLFGQLAETDLRTFRIQQDRNGLAKLLASLTDVLDPVAVLIEVAVGEVQSRDVHAGRDQFLRVLERFARRTNGTDDLRFAHL